MANKDNTYCFTEKYENELLDIVNQESLTSMFITNNVEFIGTSKVHIKSMQVSGLKNHNRGQKGFNSGTLTEQDNVFTITKDRDLEQFIDKEDMDESGYTATLENWFYTLQRTQVVPEIDKNFYSVVAAKAAEAGLTSDEYAFTPESVYKDLKAILRKGKLKLYRSMGALVLHINGDVMDALELSKDFTRKIDVTTISEGGVGIETRVTSIDGVPVIEVIDENRFYDKFDFTDGCVPTKDAKAIKVLAASQLTTKTVVKINDIYMFDNGQHTDGSGCLGQYRIKYDTYVIPNGLDNKIDSIFVAYEKAEEPVTPVNPSDNQ